MKSINNRLLIKIFSAFTIVVLLLFIGYIGLQFYNSKKKVNQATFSFIENNNSDNTKHQSNNDVNNTPNMKSKVTEEQYDSSYDDQYQEISKDDYLENLEQYQDINNLSIKYREYNFSDNKKQPRLPDSGLIVIIIDDLGLNFKQTKLFASLPKEVSLSFLSYTNDLLQHVIFAHELEHTILLHLPMQPNHAKFDPGPEALKVGMNFEKINDNIKKSFAKLNNNQWMISGVNNHMGSKFTASETEMNFLLQILSSRNVFFLDSLTTNDSKVAKVAKKYDIKVLYRDIFIDNIKTRQNIFTQLNKLKKIAQTRGYAIALAHPYKITFDILNEWLPTINNDQSIQLATPNDLIDFLYHN